jgi:hypothetical protein
MIEQHERTDRERPRCGEALAMKRTFGDDTA